MRKLIAPLIVLSLAMVTTSTRAQEAPAKVAVVNAPHIFDEMQEAKDARAQMDAEKKSLQQAQQDKVNKIKDLEDTLKQLKTDSPQFESKNKDYVQAKIEYQTWAQLQQVEVDRKIKMLNIQLFNKIYKAIQTVAERKGIDIVVGQTTVTIPDNLEQINGGQLAAALAQRSVFYANQKVVLDNDVIAQLDTDYKAAKK